MVGPWEAEIEADGWETWVPTERTLTGGLDPVVRLKRGPPEETMALERVSAPLHPGSVKVLGNHLYIAFGFDTI